MGVDAEKAFDRLQRGYLFQVMETFGFPEEFINLVKTTYKSTIAQVLTNGIPSGSFSLSRGTAQGDPLSPSLFALGIEPLAQKIRETEGIKGIRVGGKEYKLSLYADDLLLYLNNANTSIPHVIEKITDFSQISGYKMNVNKTALFPINNVDKLIINNLK